MKISILLNGLELDQEIDKMIAIINKTIIELHKKQNICRLFASIAIAFVLCAFLFWELLPKGAFYKLDAFAWCVFMFNMYGISLTYIKDRTFSYIIAFGFLCLFNNLLDETIFQNYNMTYAELLFSIIITLTLPILYVKRRNISKY